MSKVTSKLQITIPKAIAERFGIKPGDEVEWRAEGEVIGLVPSGAAEPRLTKEERLEIFRAATERQNKRNAEWTEGTYPTDRGWIREELYTRGRPR